MLWISKNFTMPWHSCRRLQHRVPAAHLRLYDPHLLPPFRPSSLCAVTITTMTARQLLAQKVPLLPVLRLVDPLSAHRRRNQWLTCRYAHSRFQSWSLPANTCGRAICQRRRRTTSMKLLLHTLKPWPSCQLSLFTRLLLLRKLLKLLISIQSFRLTSITHPFIPSFFHSFFIYLPKHSITHSFIHLHLISVTFYLFFFGSMSVYMYKIYRSFLTISLVRFRIYISKSVIKTTLSWNLCHTASFRLLPRFPSNELLMGGLRGSTMSKR